MTWWDHETKSVWSQPIGTSISGPYKGVALDLIPVGVMPWATWKAERPNTLALTAPEFPIPVDPFSPGHEDVVGSYVVGVSIGAQAKAYSVVAVGERGVINDTIGDVPVVVFADPNSRAVHVFARVVGQRLLEFETSDGQLRDKETSSLWSVATGLATTGPLSGAFLKELPYSTAYDWAWIDFYPHTELYRKESG